MDTATEAKPLTPKARQRRPVLVGSPVKFPDGNDWTIPALPLGPSGDPLSATMHQLAETDADLNIAEARQENELEDALTDLSGPVAEEEARKVNRNHQAAVMKIEGRVRKLQLTFIHLALGLFYDLTEEEVAELGVDLRTFRRVHQIVAGAPQVDELQEAIEALKGGPGN